MTLFFPKNYFGAQELLEGAESAQGLCTGALGLADLVKGTQDLESAKMQVDNERSLQAIERLEALYEVLKNTEQKNMSPLISGC